MRPHQSRFRDAQQISRGKCDAFRTQPPNLQPAPWIDMGFAVIGQLARRRMPQIRFLYIGSYVCSTLPPDPVSRRRPCALLPVRLDQVAGGTFTPELSNMPGTKMKAQSLRTEPLQLFRMEPNKLAARISISDCCAGVQNTRFACTHILRMPLSVKSRFRKWPAGVVVTLIGGTWTNWG